MGKKKEEGNWLAPASNCGGCQAPNEGVIRICAFCEGEKCDCCDRGAHKRCLQCWTAEQKEARRGETT